MVHAVAGDPARPVAGAPAPADDPASDALEQRARALVEEVEAAPRRVQRDAARLAQRAVEVGDQPARVWAHVAAGLAAQQLHDVPGAVAELRTAARLARAAGRDDLEARARMSLCIALAYAGDHRGALRQADLADPHLRGVDAVGLAVHRAGMAARRGRFALAQEALSEALARARRLGDVAWQARILNNRALVRAERGDNGGARRDLEQAAALHHLLGATVAAADVRFNQGWVAALQGEVPEALAHYDAAEAAYAGAGANEVLSLVAHDRARALLEVGLSTEARRDAEVAAGALQAQGMALDAAEAALLVARAALADGDLEAAASWARRARAGFARQGRTGWAARARHVALQAGVRAGGVGSSGARASAAARAVAADLDAAGWSVAAADARLTAAEIDRRGGRTLAAAHQLEAAAQARRRGPTEVRARAWHAEALRRSQGGDPAGALRAVRAGMRVVEVHRGALGALELRAGVASHARPLAELGLDLAVAGGRARTVLTWAEQTRAAALRHWPTRPPRDADLARDLAELRRTASALREADPDEEPALVARLAAAEERVRRRARRVPADLAHRPALDGGEVLGALGEHALVELVVRGDQLLAVAAAGGRARVVGLGPLAPVVAEAAALRASLRRMARGGSGPGVQAAMASAQHGAARLDAAVLGPVRLLVGERPLVIVPTGELHAVPWGLLPSCRQRPLSVVPSASMWVAAEAAPGRRRSGALVAAGPGLAHADAEVAEVADVMRERAPAGETGAGVTTMVGAAATVAAVGGALARVRTAHVACHGRFRADNPMFSALELADGPLTVHDLEGLGGRPEVLVLSACESGLSAVRPGDELMGLAATLLGMGTRVVVASVVPVPDEAVRTLMASFHRHLADGDGAALALARASAQGIDGADPTQVVAAGAFTCFGRG